jgi:hypothetical protein
MPTQAKDADLKNGRGAVHKASDLVQPSWRASDVEVKTMKGTVKDFAKSSLQTRPLAAVLTTAVIGLGVGAVAAWFFVRRSDV